MSHVQDPSFFHRAIVRSSTTIGATRIATAVLGLVTVPVIISKLGVTGFGVWESILAIATLVTTWQGTVTGTLMWRMSGEYGAGRKHAIPEIVRFGVATSLGLFLVLVPSAFVFENELIPLIHIPSAFRLEIREVFPLLVGLLTLTGVADTLDASINVSQRAGTTSTITAGALTTNYLIAIIGLLNGLHFFALLTGQAAGLAVRITAGSFISSRLNGRIKLSPALPSRVEGASLRYGALLAVGYISSALRDQTDKLILALFGTPLLVGYYGVAVRLASLLTELSKLFYVPLLTAAGALNAMGNWSAIKQLYGTAMRVFPLATGALLILIGGMAQQFVMLWLGKSTPPIVPFIYILLLGNVTAVTLTGPGTSICRGVGRVEIETGYVVTNLISNVVLTVLLVKTIGAFGTVVASGATWAISSIVFLFLLHRKLDLPVARSRDAIFLLAIATAIAIALKVLVPVTIGTQDRFDASASILLIGLPAVALYVSGAILSRLAPTELLHIPWRFIVTRFSKLQQRWVVARQRQPD